MCSGVRTAACQVRVGGQVDCRPSPILASSLADYSIAKNVGGCCLLRGPWALVARGLALNVVWRYVPAVCVVVFQVCGSGSGSGSVCVWVFFLTTM